MVQIMVLKLRFKKSVVLPGRALLLNLSTLALFLVGCQKSKTHESIDTVPGLSAYADKVGADKAELYAFSQSLSQLQSTNGSSSAYCLLRFSDTFESRNKLLQCLKLRGLSGLNKEFLEALVGVRLDRMQRAHSPEAAQSLRLLNWLYDISVEQYALSNPKSYWLEKNQRGNWHFSDREETNQDDYKFQEGDLILSITPSELSTLIPQYTHPERRLTHSMFFRGARDNREEHFIEAEFEEGVRYKYRDIYRGKDRPYETFVLRYKDPKLSDAENLEIRIKSADYAATQIGVNYGFSRDKQDGYSCHTLSGFSFIDAVHDYSRLHKVSKFDDMRELFPIGFSPLRKGLSRIYATKFGMAEDLVEFPTAGNFISSSYFETTAIYVKANVARKFSDLYTVAEATIDSLDRGSEIVISEEQRQKIEPMIKDRKVLQEIIGMVRKLKRHTLMRNAIKDANVSLQLIEQLSVEEFKAILQRLDAERRVLVEAATDEVGYGIGSNAFGMALDLSKNDGKSKIKIGGFLKDLQSRGADNFKKQDFDQLKLFMANLDVNKIKEVVNYQMRGEEDFSGRMPVMGAMLKIMSEKNLSRDETSELTEALRTYALFLLSVPSLQKKVLDLEAKDIATLESVIKQAPYIASSLSNETLIEFGTYKKMASGIVEKYDEIRTKTDTEFLWQTPPWIQRTWLEFILSRVPVMNYR